MRNKPWTTMRGRPQGRHYSYRDMRLLEYLDRISVKHEIDPSKLFSSFQDALQHEGATCGKLSIKCRARTRNHAIFLLTDTQKVITQFLIPMRILAKTDILEEFSHTRRL